MKRSEIILDKIDSFDILNYYLKPYHNHSELKKGTNISNPFIGRIQETPSFNIFKCNNTGQWKFKDFATGDKGNCFDLVMKIYNLDFTNALDRIEKDFNITQKKYMNTVNHHKPQEYSVKTEKFNEVNITYWKQFQITKEVLEDFNVTPVIEYTAISKIGNQYTIKATDTNPIFCYNGDNWKKIYKPLDDKKYKFQHFGNKESNFIFGYKELPTSDDILFITGGEKDVLTLTSQGYNAISLNSETATLNPLIAKDLKNRFNSIIVYRATFP